MIESRHSMAFRFWRSCLLSCLRQLLVQFAITHCGDQRIDDRRQPLQRRDDNCRFSLLELDGLPTGSNEKSIRAAGLNGPPWQDALLHLGERFLASFVLRPWTDNPHVGRIVEQSLLLFQPRNDHRTADQVQKAQKMLYCIGLIFLTPFLRQQAG